MSDGTIVEPEPVIRPTNISKFVYLKFVDSVRCSGLNVRTEIEKALQTYFVR